MTQWVQALLDGPWGRRLCWEVLVAEIKPLPDWAWRAILGATVDPGTVAHQLARIDPVEPAGDAGVVLEALAATVDTAWYWQAPQDLDVLLARPAVRRALTPAAQALAAAEATAWWSRPVLGVPQHYVQWIYGPEQHEVDPPPLLQGTATRLRRRVEAPPTEHRRSRRRVGSGEGWSTPGISGLVASQLVSTTGPGPSLPAVGLVLVENADPICARLWPLAPESEARVYEITGPGDWAHLVQTHPLELPWSRDPRWSTITDQTGPWVIPDWAAVAQDYDGVHLTVTGWLNTIGRSIPVQEEAHSMLAGWDPDATWWITDTLHPAGEITSWHPTGAGRTWEPGPPR